MTSAAALLGVQRTTLHRWVCAGCPTVTKADRSRGIEWGISIPAVVQWRTERAVSAALAGLDGDGSSITREEADRRRAVAQAITAEVEADEALDLVVGRSDAQADIAAFTGTIARALKSAAGRIATKASKITRAPEIHSVCEVELNRAFDAAQAELATNWQRGD